MKSPDDKATEMVEAFKPLADAAERLRDRRTYFVRVLLDEDYFSCGWFTMGTIRHFIRRGYRVEGIGGREKGEVRG
jgi:hypothetical protein